jgi:hypothetical protein
VEEDCGRRNGYLLREGQYTQASALRWLDLIKWQKVGTDRRGGKVEVGFELAARTAGLACSLDASLLRMPLLHRDRVR